MTDSLISLDEAARLIPGATADTLKRKARAGMLTVYRPSKAYCTTKADVERMIAACRVAQKAPAYGSAPVEDAALPLGLSKTQVGSTALDSVLEQAKPKKRKR